MSAQPQSASANAQTVDPATGKLVVVWAIVLVPLAYGIFNTLLKAAPLFG